MNQGRVRMIMVAAVATLALAACGSDPDPGPAAGTESETSGDLAGYPENEMTVIMPFGAGGTIDGSTRLLTESWDSLDVPFVNVNQPGGVSEVGALGALGGDQEGYTLFVNSHGILTIMADLLSDRVDRDDFAPIGSTMDLEAALLVRNDGPWQDGAEFIEALQGEDAADLTIGLVSGNEIHLMALQMLEALGSEATIVPFESGGDARNAVAGGHVDSTMIPAAGYPALAEDARILFVLADENVAPELTDNAPTWSEVTDVELTYINQIIAWYVSTEFAEAYPERYDFLVDSFSEAAEGSDFATAMEGINYGPWVHNYSPEELLQKQAEAAEFAETYGDLLTQ